MVARRIEFLTEMLELERMMTKYSGPNCMIETPPNLTAGEREHVLVVHDERTFYTNDDKLSVWVEAGKGHALKRKNVGASVNDSKFLSEKRGILRMTDDEYVQHRGDHPDSDLQQDASVIMKCGTKYARDSINW